MEVREYVLPLRKWWWLIVLSTLAGGSAGYLIVRQQPSVYQAQVTVQIGQSIIQDPNPVTSVLWVSQQLALTYADISKRAPVRDATMRELGLASLPDYSARPVPDTQLMEIIVTDTNPERAQAVSNELANQLILQSPTSSEQEEQERQIFIDRQLDDLEEQITRTQESIDQKQDELRTLFGARQIADAEQQIAELQGKLSSLQSNYADLLANSKRGAVNTLTVVEPATLPRRPIGPNVGVMTLLAGVIGMVLSASAAYVIEYLDDSIRTPDDVSRVSGLPTLAGIARIRANGDKSWLITLTQPRSPISEAYRVLRTGIQFSSIDNPNSATILVTSANPTEGKSLTVANLAIVMAQSGRTVIVVDADLRRPRQAEFFALGNHRGLTNFFLEYSLTDSSERTLELLRGFIRESSVAGLHVLPSGPIAPNPSELLGSTKMKTMLQILAGQFDYVIVDSPPALAVTDAVVLSTRVNGVLLIADNGRTKRAQLRQATEQLKEVGAHLIGVVLNRLSPRGDGYYYYYQSSYYQRKEEADDSNQRAANGKTNGWLKRLKKQTAADQELKP